MFLGDPGNPFHGIAANTLWVSDWRQPRLTAKVDDNYNLSIQMVYYNYSTHVNGTGTILVDNLTTNQKWQMPNRSGTFALDRDIDDVKTSISNLESSVASSYIPLKGSDAIAGMLIPDKSDDTRWIGTVGHPWGAVHACFVGAIDTDYHEAGFDDGCVIALQPTNGNEGNHTSCLVYKQQNTFVYANTNPDTTYGSLEIYFPAKSGTIARLEDIPISLPASDVKDWAKAATKPSYTWTEIGSKPDTFTPSAHTHTIANITNLQTALDGKAATSHTHVITNVTGLQSALDGKAASSHTHGDADITSVDASKITGTISIDHLPQGALDRLVRVDDDAARFKLTTENVQLGDTVKVKSSGLMYYVVDESKLGEEAGYEPYTAGSATSVPWTGVTGKPSTFTPSAHTHTIANVTGLQTALDGKAASSHTHAIANVTGLQTALDGKAASSHTHTKSQITDFPTSIKNPTSLSIQLNGGTATTYDGSTAKSINITPAGIGAAASSHTHTIANVTGLQTALDGKAASGHNHDTVYSKLNHTHTIANVTGLQTALDSKVNNAPTVVTNWNSATNAGYYYAAKGAANAPEATLGYFGQVCKSTTSIMQTIFPEGASGDIKQYMRRGTISGSAVTWETDWACITYALS